MSRVAICLGVDNPGLLTPLRAAASSARKFGAWLKVQQKFDRVEVLVDSGPSAKPVVAGDVRKVVKELVDMGPTQLVVYFSGHGLLNGNSETWLLSGASQFPDEAIDLTASREAATLLPVPNVVFISDACRALPTNLPTSSIRGILIFPTPTTLPRRGADADVFYAATRTGVALEVPVDPGNPNNKEFKSLFTEVLLQSYIDPPSAITLLVTPVGEAGPVVVVPNRKLRPVLIDRVIDEAETHFPGRAPAPVIRLESDDASFIGRAQFSVMPAATTEVVPELIEISGTPRRPSALRNDVHKLLFDFVAEQLNRPRSEFHRGMPMDGILPMSSERDLISFGETLNRTPWCRHYRINLRPSELRSLDTLGDLETLIQGKLPGIPGRRRPAKPAPARGKVKPERGDVRSTPRKQGRGVANRLRRQLKDDDVKAAFESQKAIDSGSGGFETRSGIELIGAKLLFAEPTRGSLGPSPAGRDGRTRWHYTASGAPPSIAVGFEGGGTIVTCLPEFVTSITVVDGRVVNVSFIPARNGKRWRRYSKWERELNQLRAKVAAAARFGRLDIEPGEAHEFAEVVRELKELDPTLGLYAAYAYAEIGARADIGSVRSIMRGDLQVSLYDLAMLADRHEPKKRGEKIAPFCPMLSQGWSYALAYGIKWPKAIKDATRLPALWTTFDSDGIKKIANAIKRGGLK